jgi:GT2 family glycosyltransferase
MADRPLVYCIVLNFNGALDTIECLESLRRITYGNCRTIIVDNGSSDGSAAEITGTFPDLPLILTGKNLGYAAGNNIGMRRALEQGAAYICILNNDTVVDPGFLEPLIDRMEQDRAIGIAGPKVCEYRDHAVIQATGSRANLFLGTFPQLNKGANRDAVHGLIAADYVGGACMLASRGTIAAIGMMPEHYFLFFEETEWCHTAKLHHFDVVCVCDSVVYHKGAQATGKIHGIQDYYMTRNQIIFEKRNATGPQLAVFLAYRTLQVAGSLAKRLITGNPNRDMFKGFWDGIKYRRTDAGEAGGTNLT